MTAVSLSPRDDFIPLALQARRGRAVRRDRRAEAVMAGARCARPTRTWLRVAVSLVLIVVLLSGIGFDDVVEVLQQAMVWPILVSALLAVASRFVVAYRWYVLVRTSAKDIGFATLLHTVFVSGFLGFFMPGAVGVELVRVFALARLTDTALAVSSVLIERLTAMMALAGIVLLGLLVAPAGLPDAVATAALATAVLLAAGFVGLCVPRIRPLYLAMLRGRLLERARPHLAAFFDQIDAFRRAPWLMTELAGLSVGLQLVRVLEGMFLAVALGIDVELAYLCVIIPAGVLITMLPISLAGLGVREALYVALFGAIGVDAASAFTLSLMNFLLCVIFLLLPGAVLYALGGIAPNRQKLPG